MRYLITARHGHDIDGRNLSKTGKVQIGRLTESLKEFTTGKRVILFSSKSFPAMFSTEAIGTALSLVFGLCPALYDDGVNPPNLDGILLFVDKFTRDADVIILITHAPHAKLFPQHFGRERMNGAKLGVRELDNGQAIVIDVETGTEELLP